MRYFSIRVLILKKFSVGNLPHLEATETQLTKEERNFAFRAFSILRVFLLDNRDKFQDEFSLVKRNTVQQNGGSHTRSTEICGIWAKNCRSGEKFQV